MNTSRHRFRNGTRARILGALSSCLLLPNGFTQDCPDISGLWNVEETVRVTQTIGGDTTTSEASGSGTMIMEQDGCNIHFTSQGINPVDGSVITLSRDGTVDGDLVTYSGGTGVIIPGASCSENNLTGVGLIEGNVMTITNRGLVNCSVMGIGIHVTIDGTTVWTRPGYTISGRVVEVEESWVGIAGVDMTLSGSSGSQVVTTDALGDYSFRGLSPGNYTLTPDKSLYRFTPDQRTVNLSGDVVLPDFEGYQRRLVVITHGWNSNAGAWAVAMRDNVAAQLSDRYAGKDIQVHSQLWTEHDSSLPPSPAYWDVVTLDWQEDANRINPYRTIPAARRVGRRFANLLQDEGYVSMHLIAHSAGSWLIDTIADAVVARDQERDTETDIHLTFLDAFAPNMLMPPSSASWLGDHASWAEQYVTDDILHTGHSLPHAYNLDLDNVMIPENSGMPFNHSFPWKWYLGTTFDPVNPVFIDPANASVRIAYSAYGWGFQRSVEYAGQHPSFADYPRGTRVDLASNETTGVATTTSVTVSGVPIEEAMLSISDGGLVSEIDADGFTMTTGSPVWVEVAVSIPQTVNEMRFDYEFLSQRDGVLQVWFDEDLVFVAEEQFSQGAQTSSWTWAGSDVEPGQHTIRFELEAAEVGSAVRISLIETGFSTVSELTPTLHLGRNGAAYGLSWPGVFSHWKLMTAPTPEGPWSPASDAGTVVGDTVNLDLSVEVQDRFLRLQSP